MMNMKLLKVIKPQYIYHGCSTQKTFSIVGEFSAVNMKNCGRHNVSKHREIKGSGKYVTLDILLKFGSMDNMRITSSDPNDFFGILGKGLITSMGIRAKVSLDKYKNSRYDIGNGSKKDV